MVLVHSFTMANYAMHINTALRPACALKHLRSARNRNCKNKTNIVDLTRIKYFYYKNQRVIFFVCGIFGFFPDVETVFLRAENAPFLNHEHYNGAYGTIKA